MELPDFLNAGLRWVWETSLYGALLAALVFVAQKLFRRQLSARWANALWLLVAARLLVPAGPESQLSLSNLFTDPPPAPASEEQAELTVYDLLPGSPVADGEWDASFEQSGLEGAAELPKVPRPLREVAGSILALAWLVVATWMLAGSALGAWVFSRRLRAQSRPITEASALAAANEARANLGFRGNLALLETPLVSSPALFGMFAPKLLLPVGMTDRLSADDLRHVLAHEVAHLKRRDLQLEWVFSLMRAIHWFNPLGWFITRMWRATREVDCDSRALAAFSFNARAYGETLLKLATNQGTGRAPLLVGILEGRMGVEQRIRALGAAPSKRGRAVGIALVACLMVAGFTSAPAAGTLQAEPKDSKGDATPDLIREMERRELAERAANAQYQFDPAKTPPSNNKPAPQRGVISSGNRDLIAQRMNSTIIPEFSLPEETPLADAIKALSEAAKKADPSGIRLSFILWSDLQNSEIHKRITQAADSPLVAGEAHYPKNFRVSLEAPLKQATVAQVLAMLLDAVRPPQELGNLVASEPVRHPKGPRMRLEDYAIVVSVGYNHLLLPAAPATDLRTRRFSIPDVSRFLNVIGAEGPTATLQEPLRKFIEGLGIDLTPRVAPSGAATSWLAPPPQKAFAFSERTGLLFVRATIEDLASIEKALHKIFPPLVVTTIGIVVEAASDAAVFSLDFFKTAEPALMRNQGKELLFLGTMGSVEFDKLRPDLGNQGAIVITSPRITSLSGKPGMVAVGLERNASGEETAELSFTTTILPEPNMMRVEAGLRFLNKDSVSGAEKELLSALGTGEVWDGQTLVFGVRAPEGDKLYLLFVTPMIFPEGLEAP